MDGLGEKSQKNRLQAEPQAVTCRIASRASLKKQDPCAQIGKSQFLSQMSRVLQYKGTVLGQQHVVSCGVTYAPPWPGVPQGFYKAAS
jgi:hypothetical protein